MTVYFKCHSLMGMVNKSALHNIYIVDHTNMKHEEGSINE